MLKAIIFSSLLLNIGLLIGRFSGFLRESLLAGSFGISAQADVAVMMLSVPDLLINILVGGGVAAALIPEFDGDKKRSLRLWWQALLFFTLLFALLTCGLVFSVAPLIKLLAPGFDESQILLSLVPMQYVLWLVPMTVATGVISAYLQAYNRFGVAALGTLTINIVIIMGLVFISFYDGSLITLAVFVLLGGLLRLAIQYVAAQGIAGKPVMSVSPWIINQPLIVRFFQVAGTGCVLLCFPVIIRAFASYDGEGSVAQISYAIKLVELPLAVTVTFLATVLFPRLSHSYKEDFLLFQQLVVWGIRATLFLSLMSVAALVPVSAVLTSLVYGYGNMTDSDIFQVSSLLTIGLLYIPFMGMATFATVVLNAQKDTKTPLFISLAALGGLLLLTFNADSGLLALMKILVIAYAIAGIGSFVALLIKFPIIRRDVFDPGYLFIILLLPLSLYWLLKISLIEPFGFTSLLIAFVLAGLGCFLGLLVVPVFRDKLMRKLRNL
ncbi:lipid II flippase MurJ [Neptunomonas sp.]|uniref:lipid II flippase MurJ n=1 Tax=Neptunomonas sp. TaxID=1971898 RepID=UPI0035619026